MVRIKHPTIKEVSRDQVGVVLAANPLYDLNYGFLHIPKTGGTSVMAFLAKAAPFAASMPVPLFHSWTFRLVAEYFPTMKVSFLLRDPLERLVSGYFSRLRQGNPEYHVPWRPQEAAAFGLYPSIESFLNGLLDETDFHVSATAFMMDSLSAMHWNYAYYFESVECVRSFSSMFGVVRDAADLQGFLMDWIQGEGVNAFGENAQILMNEVVSSCPMRHRSARSASSVLQSFAEDQIEMMRDRLRSEYLIYNELVAFGVR